MAEILITEVDEIHRIFYEFICKSSQVEECEKKLKETEKELTEAQNERIEFFKKFKLYSPEVKTKVVEYAKEILTPKITEENEETIKNIIKCLDCQFNVKCSESKKIYKGQCYC